MTSLAWGRPAGAPGPGWVVVDVETSGFRPGRARVLSVAALALDADGHPERSLVSLLNPGVDPGPTDVHGLTTATLRGAPQFCEVVDELAELLDGRTLVAHNAGFDYAFLAAEAELAGAELPIDTVMCTVELARRLDLGVDNLRLDTLAAHWDVMRTRAHDAYDDALVLSGVLAAALRRAGERGVWLPVRPVTRRRWPNGRVTHEELRPLKALASRMPCRYLNPGRYVAGRPLIRGMRVALSAECGRTHDELLERLLHAGLVYVEAVDAETSLVICNDAEPVHGKGYRARQLGVPVIADEQFIDCLAGVVGGTGVEEFSDGAADAQLELF